MFDILFAVLLMGLLGLYFKATTPHDSAAYHCEHWRFIHDDEDKK